MEIAGKITRVLEEKSGQSARGVWRKQEYVLETQSQYPKQICFNVWGDKIDEFGIAEGQELQVSIDIESREYNERWYTDVKAWKVAPLGSNNGNSGDSHPNRPPSHSEQPPPYDDEIPF